MRFPRFIRWPRDEPAPAAHRNPTPNRSVYWPLFLKRYILAVCRTIMPRQLPSRCLPTAAAVRSTLTYSTFAAEAARHAMRGDRLAAVIKAPALSVLSIRMHAHVPQISALTTCCTPLRSSPLLCPCAPRSFSTGSRNGPAGSRGIIFLPALTIPRFLRGFAVMQAACCLVSGTALSLLHNPFTGGTLKSVGSAFH
jgi:hypothetical protein